MASISKAGDGRRRILFFGADRKRHAIRLGKVIHKLAQAVLAKVESLAAASISHTPWPDDTAAWVAAIDAAMYQKLAAVGLVPPRGPAPESSPVTLGEFVDQYISTRTDVKQRTRINLNQARRHLVRFFGPDKPLGSVTPGDADEYRQHLMTGLSENTARRHCGRAKQFFRAAVRKRLLAQNPFADMKGCGVRANASRLYFVTREEAQSVLDACPDAQWRLLFALSRYGGLRCPSEHLALKWGHVDWDRGRITVPSPKTERHEGGESRQIPIFPELRPCLEEVFEQAQPGTDWVITRYPDSNSNLRTQLQRIIAKAGLKPWPKLFQNLRSTRETELAEDYPIHMVCAWIGNSQAVAAKHYLQVTDEHFDAAVQGGTESGAPVAQIPAHSLSAPIRQERQETPKTLGLTSFGPNLAESGELWQTGQVPPGGLEPPTC